MSRMQKEAMNGNKLVVMRKEGTSMLQVSLPTFDALLNREVHPIPHVRVNRKVLIPVAELEKWLAEESKRGCGV